MSVRRVCSVSLIAESTLGDIPTPIIFFFFQAEDGIRDHCVTGVQTCALPISVDAVVTFSGFGAGFGGAGGGGGGAGGACGGGARGVGAGSRRAGPPPEARRANAPSAVVSLFFIPSSPMLRPHPPAPKRWGAPPK